MRPASAACIAGCVMAGMLAAILPPAMARDRGEYFASIDRDGDGRISLAEFQDYMSRGFRAMDRNGDGILQDHELPEGVVLRPGQPRTLSALLANLERAFHRMDRDATAGSAKPNCWPHHPGPS
ncbi:EF-hand domain-containing protein [Alkalisalibacterium limincola]|uniref:EF-hand domain-containing protein n=1 Tax=Alkalisalibacterium limincola TaxID=2699169 RepID=UPI002104875C|nr:EF-hand domain-containing protein [Alkalisalibacterium limincola]